MLDHYLKPLQPLLCNPDLQEISVIGDQTIGLEHVGKGYVFQEDEHLNTAYWRRLCKVLANANGLKFNPPEHSFLSVALPGGHRFQAKLGQGVDSRVDISIRLFRNRGIPMSSFGLNADEEEYLISKIQSGVNCIISGGTSSGKTTFLRDALSHIPAQKRILTLEDTREIFLPSHEHVVHHVVARNGSKEEQTKSYSDEIDHMMRSRPDVIVLGEVSTSNAFPILRFLNSGHAGFFSTVHANTAELALSAAIPQNITLSGHNADGVATVLKSTIDIVIQLNKVTEGSKQRRLITEIYLPKEDIYLKNEL